MSVTPLGWSPESICLHSSPGEMQTLAANIYRLVCRTDFETPGFCIARIDGLTDSQSFRRIMVDLKQAMSSIHESVAGKSLAWLSAVRFDQQETTRPHLDGGPEECFLMLGYEPSEIESELELADYSRCALDLGMTPRDFLSRHNPMFQTGADLLRPYTTRVPCFNRSAYQIVCINNSSAPRSAEKPAWQGVLHTATIVTPDESLRRVVNSTMIASVPLGAPDSICLEEIREFVETDVVRRRGYDKPHLNDHD